LGLGSKLPGALARRFSFCELGAVGAVLVAVCGIEGFD
jgi:hypothetical protein